MKQVCCGDINRGVCHGSIRNKIERRHVTSKHVPRIAIDGAVLDIRAD
jgi:hypothetical protein